MALPIATETVPSWPKVTLAALGGMVMLGTMGKPEALTTCPVLFILKLPSRVYDVVPSGIWIWKKPAPMMATSSGDWVLTRLPCKCSFSVALILTPVPSIKPVGVKVLTVVCPPGCLTFW